MSTLPETPAPQTVEVTKRRFSIGIFILAFFLMVLLVTLGETLLQDLADIPTRPALEDYQDRYRDKALESAKEAAEKAVALALARVQNISWQRREAEEKYLNAKDILDTLLQVKNARSAAGEKLTPREAKELARAQERYLEAKKKYELLLRVRRAAEKALEQAREPVSLLEKQIASRMDLAQRDYDGAMLRYQLLVTLLRILFVVPVVLAAVYLYVNQRQSRYAALVWAYLIFAAYVFLRAAYEYVPTFHFYGIRVFGTAVLVVLIVMTIRYFHRTSDERLMAEIKAHLLKRLCPNCKFPFVEGPARYLVSGMGRLSGRKAAGLPLEVIEPAKAPVFCRSCGLAIVDQCPACREFKYALIPYCPRCRAYTSVTERVAAR